MNAPTRTGRARLLFAAILIGAAVVAGMAPALATSSLSDAVSVLDGLTKTETLAELQAADALREVVGRLGGGGIIDGG